MRKKPLLLKLVDFTWNFRNSGDRLKNPVISYFIVELFFLFNGILKIYFMTIMTKV